MWQQAMICQSEIPVRTDLNYTVEFERRRASHHNLAKVTSIAEKTLLWFSKQNGMHPWRSRSEDSKKGRQMGPAQKIQKYPRIRLLNWPFCSGTVTETMHLNIIFLLRNWHGNENWLWHKCWVIRKWHEMRHDNIQRTHYPMFSSYFMMFFPFWKLYSPWPWKPRCYTAYSSPLTLAYSGNGLSTDHQKMYKCISLPGFSQTDNPRLCPIVG